MVSVNDIRTTFLDFFEKNNQTVVNSSPLVYTFDIMIKQRNNSQKLTFKQEMFVD